MGAFIIRRLIQSMFVFLMVTITVFFSMRLLPGDPILVVMSPEEKGRVSEEQLQKLRHEFGLDRPIIVQYVRWLSNIIHGDFGVSVLHNTEVKTEILRRVPITLHLGILAIILSTVFGILFGVISAIRRGRWLDTIVTLLANIGITAPPFWLGILLVYIFSLHFKILPVFGYTSPFEDLWLSTKQVIMPVFCLSLFPLAMVARQTRSCTLEVMGQDYIRSAWAKGLKERVIVTRHVLKNALIPVVTLTVISMRNIIGGAVITETVFNIPGLGRLAVTGITTQDYAVAQAVILVMVFAVVLTNLAIDISYGWFDPRVQYE